MGLFKKSFLKSGLLTGMTDIHCHILPGVDDGMKSWDEAVSALQWLHANGVARLYLTPHVMSDFPKNRPPGLRENFDDFTKRLHDDAITDIPELKLAGEYMLESAFEAQKEEGLLTYANRHVLVETSYMSPPVGLLRLLDALTADGYTPILAHPERYIYMDMDDYDLLHQKHHIKFQLNYLSLVEAYGRHAKEKAIELLKRGRYTYAASDFHRLPRHQKSYQAKKLTKTQLKSLHPLFENNQTLW